jgi:predicted  nucleic acid-binding Zn-ribbon protein
MADTFFADQIANATTEEARQRLEDIDAYRNQMFELRAAMRNAKTEEERAALEEQADAARDNLQQLTKEQQRAMLVDVGRNYGLKGEDLQAFQREMREVIESPFFRMGGPGGGGRGRGGPFGGGGPGR